MVIRYLRRTPKRAPGAAAARGLKSAALPLVVMPEEAAVMARALAYFCAACGREHPSGEVRETDICCADMKIKSAIRGARP